MISAKEHQFLLLLVSRWEKAGLFKPVSKKKIPKRFKFLAGAAVFFILPAFCLSAETVSAADVKPASVEVAAAKSSATTVPQKSKKALIAKVKKEEKKDDKKTKEKIVEKSAIGMVGFIRKDKMAVELNGGEGGEEILFAVDEKVKLTNAKDLSQIKYGVFVRVIYNEVFLDPKKEGEAPTILKRVVKEIKFIKPAASSLASSESSGSSRGPQ